jgi:hypothetical protein
MLGSLSLDPTCLMLMAASADCALKAVAFRAQVRAAGGRSDMRFPTRWNHPLVCMEPLRLPCRRTWAPASATPTPVVVVIARVCRWASESGVP